MKIGYCKIGRSMQLTSGTWGMVGGDQEAIIVLRKLATRYPQHEFVLIGRNSGEDPADIKLPPNVTNPWPLIHRGVSPARAIRDASDAVRFTEKNYAAFKPYADRLDAYVVWLGQHGTSNNPIPKVGFSWADGLEYFTKPQTSFLNYASYIIHALNDHGDRSDGAVEPVFMCTDARNTVKCRDLKWPARLPVLGLFDLEQSTKHDRWDDPRDPKDLGFNRATWVGEDDPGVWYSNTDYIYSGVEVATMLPYGERMAPDLKNFDARRPFGMIVNEARAYVDEDRLSIIRDWVMPIKPAFIHGEWSDESLASLGVKILPVSHRQSFDRLATVRTTLTTPSSGSGWTTRKPWESFAAGVVCFFHPSYDVQGHVIPTLFNVNKQNYSDAVRRLVKWLRCTHREDFWSKYKQVNESRELWEELVFLQHELLKAAIKAEGFMKHVDNRIAGWESHFNATASTEAR